nr:hypothetical protein [Dyella sp. ASV24]
MKRRTRKRIIRTVITCLVVGTLAVLASWHRWQDPVDGRAAVAIAMHDRQVASCQQQILAKLQGQRVDAWRLVDEQGGAQGREFTFAANFNEQRTLYHCIVDASAAVTEVDGPE